MKVIRFSMWLIILYGHVSVLYGSDQRGASGRYSPLVYWMMERLASTNSLRQFADQVRCARPRTESNSIHTELFRNAQKEIGIAEESILPIVDAISDEEHPYGVAVTASDKITVFPNNFKDSYGVRRIVALHEAFHHKYHDAVFEKWLLQKIGPTVMTGMIVTTTIGLEMLSARYIQNKTARIACYIASPMASIISNSMLWGLGIRQAGLLERPLNSYDRFKEYRADVQSILHANCYQCVFEHSQAYERPSDEYLSDQEVAQYVERFREENRLCPHHTS